MPESFTAREVYQISSPPANPAIYIPGGVLPFSLISFLSYKGVPARTPLYALWQRFGHGNIFQEQLIQGLASSVKNTIIIKAN